jgi:hypothetical protein
MYADVWMFKTFRHAGYPASGIAEDVLAVSERVRSQSSVTGWVILSRRLQPSILALALSLTERRFSPSPNGTKEITSPGGIDAWLAQEDLIPLLRLKL